MTNETLSRALFSLSRGSESIYVESHEMLTMYIKLGVLRHDNVFWETTVQSSDFEMLEITALSFDAFGRLVG